MSKALNIQGPALVIGFISDGPDTEEFSWSENHTGPINSAQELAEWLSTVTNGLVPTTMLVVQNDEVVAHLSQREGDFGE